MSTEKIRKTGGNNVPLVEQDSNAICIAGNIVDRQPQNGGNGLGCQDDLAYTLTATDRHAVFSRQRVDAFRQNNVASTQSARQYKDATDLICQQAEACAHLIRRSYSAGVRKTAGLPGRLDGHPQRIELRPLQSPRQQCLLGQSHYVNGGHKNGMNTRLLGILLHIILHISTFNHSS